MAPGSAGVIPGDRFAALLYAGAAQQAHHLPHGSYSGHYSDHRHTNTLVQVTLDQAGTCVLMLTCGQCPPTFDEQARPLHRRGCPSC